MHAAGRRPPKKSIYTTNQRLSASGHTGVLECCRLEVTGRPISPRNLILISMPISRAHALLRPIFIFHLQQRQQSTARPTTKKRLAFSRVTGRKTDAVLRERANA